MDWIFDGIGTEIVITLIGLIIGAGAGGAIGYKIGINRSVIVQKQKAGKRSKQEQVGKVYNEITNNDKAEISFLKINQKQKGGKDSVQSQIGGIGDDK